MMYLGLRSLSRCSVIFVLTFCRNHDLVEKKGFQAKMDYFAVLTSGTLLG